MISSPKGVRIKKFAAKSTSSVVLACVAVTVFSASAFAVSDRVKDACRKDYDRFCAAYSIGTPELRTCMQSNGKKLTNRCFRALVDAGEVPRKFRNVRN